MKDLATSDSVQQILRTNSVLVEVSGSIKRITLDKLMDSMNVGETQLLRQIAWGVPLMDALQSSPQYGVIGNTAAWEEYKRLSGRYLVTNAGLAAKLSKLDSSIYADGTALDETKGHIMSIFPRLYFLVQNDSISGIPYLWMSMLPISGYYIGEANNGQHNVIGSYKGYINGTALVSRSGYAPTGNKTINQFWTAAQVNGVNWGLTSYNHRKLMIMHGLSDYGNTNMQVKLGYGVGGSSSLDLWATAATLLTGATKSLGDASGKIDISVVNGANTGVNCSRVSHLTIEDAYNWQWEMIQNIFCGSSANSGQTGSEIFLYKGNRMPSTSELAAHPTGEYRQLSRLTSSGYIKTLLKGDYFDIFPATLGGDSTSYWCDYSYASPTGQLVYWGGYANCGADAGLAYASSAYAWSHANSGIGSRLAYYGPLTFVDGKNII